MAYWASVGSAERLPVDIEPPGPNTVESARTVLVTFDREETLTLLQKVPAAYQTQLNEVLLTALVQATTEWTGRPALVLDLEGHGRESLGEETVDVSRTVGWFTTIFPVRLEVRTGAGPGEALKAVKEQLRQTPNRGLGYGLLRYMTRDAAIARQGQACGPTDLVFNYLGQFDQSDRAGAVRLTDEPCGPLYSGQSSRHHLVEVNSWIVGGRLRVAWTYSANVHRDASIERVAARLAEALRALVAHCLSPEAGGYTPSDFPDADLTQEELDAVLETLDEDDGAEPKAAAVSRGTGAHVSDRRGPR
jgi:non-ribosomal peptide synthase protein (TIGR01720 family)